MGLIRLFLFLSVTIWHMPDRNFVGLDAGLAVLFFFILSGFYMALTINEQFCPDDIARAGWRRRFYLSRLFRLYPAYLAVLAATVAWYGVSGKPTVFLDDQGLSLPAVAGIVALTIFIVGQDLYKLLIWAGGYAGAAPVTHAIYAHMPAGFFKNSWIVIPQAWSLASELLFHAMAPFLVRSVNRIVLFLVLGLCLRSLLIFGETGFMSELWGYRFFPATIGFFLMGSLSYHLYRRVRGWRPAAWLGGMLSAVILTFVVVSMWRWHGILVTTNFATGYDTAVVWAAYLSFAGALPCLFVFWRKHRFDRWLGELSYPLYLTHYLGIEVVFKFSMFGQTETEIMAAVLAFGMAALVFLPVDRPIDAWLHRRFSPPAYEGAARFENQTGRTRSSIPKASL